jgi:hypothetical protein
MSARIKELERRMAEASAAMNFEEARRLRDEINLIRGGASAEAAAQADTSGLSRQRAGAMGKGTSQPKPVLPEGWKPPRKPDPMTSGSASSLAEQSRCPADQTYRKCREAEVKSTILHILSRWCQQSPCATDGQRAKHPCQ